MSDRPDYMTFRTAGLHGEEETRAVTECGECFALILVHRESEHASWHEAVGALGT